RRPAAAHRPAPRITPAERATRTTGRTFARSGILRARVCSPPAAGAAAHYSTDSPAHARIWRQHAPGAVVKFGVVVFPGTNCDHATLHVPRDVVHQPAEPLWHESTDLAGYDCVILPGGFAHGDYLRAGAIARFSPIMAAVERFARADGLVWGICNGFQVLLEAGPLPRAVRPHAGPPFRLPG